MTLEAVWRWMASLLYAILAQAGHLQLLFSFVRMEHVATPKCDRSSRHHCPLWSARPCLAILLCCCWRLWPRYPAAGQLATDAGDTVHYGSQIGRRQASYPIGGNTGGDDLQSLPSSSAPFKGFTTGNLGRPRSMDYFIAELLYIHWPRDKSEYHFNGKEAEVRTSDRPERRERVSGRDGSPTSRSTTPSTWKKWGGSPQTQRTPPSIR